MGDTYTKFRPGEEVFSNPNTTYYNNGASTKDWVPPRTEAEYRVADYFDTEYPLNLFGMEPLIEEREAGRIDASSILSRRFGR